jgi:hypothetical protein
MGLELVIFIAAVLFGIFLYWRESNGNGAYRFFNKLVNSKKLQMRADNPKGFVFKQAFLPRLIFVVSLVLIAALIVEFLTPVSVFGSYNGISAFSSFAAGTLIGTYVANFVIKSSEVIEEKNDSLEDMVNETIDKGKDFIEDLKTKKEEEVLDEGVKEKPKKEEKSARERLKDKGLL